jgi:putative transposase
MDFMTDALADGRRFRVLNVVDDFTRECLAIEAGRSLTGSHVVAVLDRLVRQRGAPEAIVSDNGPEFCSRAVDAWAHAERVQLRFIRPANRSRTHMSRASMDDAATSVSTSICS